MTRLPPGPLDALLQPENKATLASVLQHHVVSGALKAADLTTGSLETIGGSSLDITAEGGTVTFLGANVTSPDTAAGNGVGVYVIRSLTSRRAGGSRSTSAGLWSYLVWQQRPPLPGSALSRCGG